MKIDDRFRALKGAAAPDLWDDIVHRDPRTVRGPSRTARYVAAAVALALAAGGLALAVRAFSGRDEPRPAITPEPTAPATTIDPTEPVTLEFEGIDRMTTVVSGFGSVWVTEMWGARHQSLLRLDPETAELVARIPVSTTPYPVWGGAGLAVGDGQVWIVNAVRFDGGRDQAALVRVDPGVEAETEVIPLGGEAAGDVELGHGSIWVSLLDVKDTSRALLRLDPATHEVIARIPLDPDAGLEDILLARGSVWIPEYGVEGSTGTVLTRIDPRTNAVTGRLDLGASAELAVFDGDVWALTPAGFLRVDPGNAMGGPEPVPVEADPVGGATGTRESSEVAFANVAPGAGGLWFAQRQEDTLVVSRFNPETETIDASVDLPLNSSPVAMAISDDAIWVVDRGPLLHRLPLPPELTR